MVHFVPTDVSSFFLFSNVLHRKTCQPPLGKEHCTVSGSKSHHSKDTILCVLGKQPKNVFGSQKYFLPLNLTQLRLRQRWHSLLVEKITNHCLVCSPDFCFLDQQRHQVLKGRGEDGTPSTAKSSSAWTNSIEKLTRIDWILLIVLEDTKSKARRPWGRHRLESIRTFVCLGFPPSRRATEEYKALIKQKGESSWCPDSNICSCEVIF